MISAKIRLFLVKVAAWVKAREIQFDAKHAFSNNQLGIAAVLD
jgi:hypothetical protein